MKNNIQKIRAERTKKANEGQIQEINNYKWCKGVELGKDPGQSAIDEWIKLNAPKFRKKFTIDDFKKRLNELQVIRKFIRSKLTEIAHYTKKLEVIEESILIDIEDIESENKKEEKGDLK